MARSCTIFPNIFSFLHPFAAATSQINRPLRSQSPAPLLAATTTTPSIGRIHGSPLCCSKRRSSPTLQSSGCIPIAPTREGHGEPGAVSHTSTSTGTGLASHFWADMVAPSAFVPNFSSPLVHSTNPNAMCAPIQEDCGMDSHPAGGFLSYLSSNYPLPDEFRRMAPMFGNLSFASGSASYAPSEAPKATASEANTFQPMSEPKNTHSSPDRHTTPVVDVDCNQDKRSSTCEFVKKDGGGSMVGRRTIWTSDETIRLVSAWLKNSNDPIEANWKRNDQYWGAVTAMFNSTTEDDRKRECKQLKEQWHKVNRIVNAFQSFFF